MFVLAIDQGTTNTKALIFDTKGRVCASASRPCSTHYPKPGWAEQSADEIWSTTRAVVEAVLQDFEGEISALGISNQRETLVVWDAETGAPAGPAPIWQCRRTAEACAALIDDGLEPEVTALTGLGINPLFPASKLAWLLKNRPEVAALHAQGRLRAGTVDAWLIWKLTGGQSFATDRSNASRTLLFDTEICAWSARLGEIFDAPIDCLPKSMASNSAFGLTAAGVTALPAGIPIHAVMGDSHAALYGHGVRTPGPVKATIGTGSSLMMLTKDRVLSSSGLSSTIAWSIDDDVAYALEGNITVSAQAASFTADLLNIQDVATLSDMAQSVEDSDGVVFVPALAGLGAPHWDDAARGLFSGLSLGTRPEQLARATFDAILHQIADVFEALQTDIDGPLSKLQTDGGASANAWLVQMLANLLDVPVERRTFAEVGAWGAAALAFEAMGHPVTTAEAGQESFAPSATAQWRKAMRSNWRAALKKAQCHE
ncbi:MAG: FGGY family carbohydrate kinase [Pseudomonadota bacterium]